MKKSLLLAAMLAIALAACGKKEEAKPAEAPAAPAAEAPAAPAADAAKDAAAPAADRKSTRLNSSHIPLSRMPSSA